jgi:mRNA interferase RelE/StbE
MTWKIELYILAEKELSQLENQQAKRILQFLFGRLVHLDNPRSIGEALKVSKFDHFKILNGHLVF